MNGTNNNIHHRRHRDPLSWVMVLKVLVLIVAAEIWHSHILSSSLSRQATETGQSSKKIARDINMDVAEVQNLEFDSKATKEESADSKTSSIDEVGEFDDSSESKANEEGPSNHEQEEPAEHAVKRDPKVHLITYADNAYADSKLRLAKEAQSTNWFETVWACGPADLPRDFASKYAEVLKQPRGGGYWIWKYALLEQALAQVPKGDIVVYLDAGCHIEPAGETRFREYIQMIQGSPSYDILSFQTDHPEHTYTTDRIFQAFDIAPHSNIRQSFQLVGGILLVRNGPHARKWLDMVWQVLEKDQWLISDRYNEEAKAIDPHFVDNRHDQSISSVSRRLVGSIETWNETEPPRGDRPFHATRIKRRF